MQKHSHLEWVEQVPCPYAINTCISPMDFSASFTLYFCLFIQRMEDGKIQMSDLPDDCIREILLRLNNHQDLVNTGLTEVRTFQLIQETKFWRNLCIFHFTNEQWHNVLKRGECVDTLPWPVLYKRLVKYVQLVIYLHQVNCLLSLSA